MLALFSLLNKTHHCTKYHLLHVSPSVCLIQTLICLSHVMPPFVSDRAMAEFGTDHRMQNDSSFKLCFRLYDSPTDGSVNRSIGTGQLVRTVCELRIAAAILHS